MFDKKFRMLVKKTKYKTNLFYMNKGIWLIRKFLNPEEVFSLTNIFTDKNKKFTELFIICLVIIVRFVRLPIKIFKKLESIYFMMSYIK